MRRVVVTGMSAVTPLGFTFPATWKRIIKGDSGITKFDRLVNLSPNRIPGAAGQVDSVQFALLLERLSAENKNFSIDAEQLRKHKIGRHTLFASAAAKEAVDDANCSAADLSRAAVLTGSIFGGVDLTEQAARALYDQTADSRIVELNYVASYITSAAPSQISMSCGAHGGAFAVDAACASGGYAIFQAWFNILHGLWDIAVVPCADACLTPLILSSLGNMRRACSRRICKPHEASCPFDEDRDGFVPSEGAAALVLESEEHARARGARIYAVIVGAGIYSDAKDMIRSYADGIAGCIRNALRSAELSPADIQYINAHATSTTTGDPVEARAISDVFGSRQGPKIIVSSSKSQLGHMMAAAGAVELELSIQALLEGRLPPTINLRNPIAECDALDVVRGEARQVQVWGPFMSLSCGFGGLNVAIIVGKA